MQMAALVGNQAKFKHNYFSMCYIPSGHDSPQLPVFCSLHKYFHLYDYFFLLLLVNSIHLHNFFKWIICFFPLLLLLLMPPICVKSSKPSFLIFPQNFSCLYLTVLNTFFVFPVLVRISSFLTCFVYVILNIGQ